MGEESYDDQFNDGLFRTNTNNSALRRPKQWPKSVSEMRGRTDYGNQGMSAGWDTALSNYSASRPYNQRAQLGQPRTRYSQPRQAPMPWQQRDQQFYMPFWRDLSSPKNQNGW
jgi:hypothetical protein